MTSQVIKQVQYTETTFYSPKKRSRSRPSKEGLGLNQKIKSTCHRSLFDTPVTPHLKDRRLSFTASPFSSPRTPRKALFSDNGAGAGAGSGSGNEGLTLSRQLNDEFLESSLSPLAEITNARFPQPSFPLGLELRTPIKPPSPMDTSSEEESASLSRTEEDSDSLLSLSPAPSTPRTPSGSPPSTPPRGAGAGAGAGPGPVCPNRPTKPKDFSAASKLNCLGANLSRDGFSYVLNGVSFLVEQKGQGTEHRVFISHSTKNVPLTADPEKGLMHDTTFRPCDYVIKRPNIQDILGGPSAATAYTPYSLSLAAIEAVKYYRKNEAELNALGLHLPEILLLPDPYSHDDAFSIIERLHHPVDLSGWSDPNYVFTEKDHILLHALKGVFTKSVSMRQDWIADFNPRNLMWKEDRLYLVEYAQIDETDKEVELIWRNIKNWCNDKDGTWSLQSSRRIWDYLISDLSPELQEQANAWIASKIEDNGGRFPASNGF